MSSPKRWRKAGSVPAASGASICCCGACLDDACKDGLINLNPADFCEVPASERKPVMRPRPGQIRRYLDAAECAGLLPIITDCMQQSAADKVGGFMEEVTGATSTPEPPEPIPASGCKVIPLRAWGNTQEAI